MFNKLPHKPIEFVSNPRLPDVPQVVPKFDEVKGIVRNEVIYVPHEDCSRLHGVHYSAETMSLRAKLNMGVPLSPVSFGITENDPSVLMSSALHMERNIEQKLIELQNSNVDSVVEPLKTE